MATKRKDKFGWDDVALAFLVAGAVGLGSYIVFGKLMPAQGNEGEGSVDYFDPWPDSGNGDGYNPEQVPTNVDTEGQEPNPPMDNPPYVEEYPEESYSGARGYYGIDTNSDGRIDTLYLDTDFKEISWIGGEGSWYERLNIAEVLGWTPAQYQAGWLAIQGEKLGGTGTGKVMTVAEGAQTGLPTMTAEELYAYGYYPSLDAARAFLAVESAKAKGTYQSGGGGGGGGYDYDDYYGDYEQSEAPHETYDELREYVESHPGSTTSDALREMYS